MRDGCVEGGQRRRLRHRQRKFNSSARSSRVGAAEFRVTDAGISRDGKVSPIRTARNNGNPPSPPAAGWASKPGGTTQVKNFGRKRTATTSRGLGNSLTPPGA